MQQVIAQTAEKNNQLSSKKESNGEQKSASPESEKGKENESEKAVVGATEDKQKNENKTVKKNEKENGKQNKKQNNEEEGVKEASEGTGRKPISSKTPSKSSAPSKSNATTSETLSGQRLDLNTATLEQLNSLPGVGASKAKEIIAYRKKNGGFSRLDELIEVKGIGEKLLDKLKPHLYVTEK
nr:helix-hairpin-helix domain-containing protein [Paenibacillus sp. SYP-B3998]